jgi:hypothetical protein
VQVNVGRVSLKYRGGDEGGLLEVSGFGPVDGTKGWRSIEQIISHISKVIQSVAVVVEVVIEKKSMGSYTNNKVRTTGVDAVVEEIEKMLSEAKLDAQIEIKFENESWFFNRGQNNSLSQWNNFTAVATYKRGSNINKVIADIRARLTSITDHGTALLSRMDTILQLLT